MYKAEVSLLLLILVLLSGASVVLSASLEATEDVSSMYRGFLSSGVLVAGQSLGNPAQSLSLNMTGQDIQVTTNVLPQNEPSIAVNPLNSQNLVVGANDPSPGFAWLGIYSSADGGASWTRGLIPVTGALGAFDAASDPSVVFDGSGSVYYAGLAFNIQSGTPVDGSVFVSKSTDRGVSFSQTTLVSAGSSRVFNDKPFVGVDPSNGRVFVSWTRFTSSRGDTMVSYSNNGGLSFSTPLRVSTSLLNQGSVPVAGPSGVFIVWNDLSNDRIVTARSTNGGVSFLSPTVVSPYVPLPSPFPNSRF